MKEPVYQGGKRVGYIRKFDTVAAMFLLKAHAPERFRERQHVEHAGGIDVRRQNMTDEELDAEIARLQGRMNAS